MTADAQRAQARHSVPGQRHHERRLRHRPHACQADFRRCEPNSLGAPDISACLLQAQNSKAAVNSAGECMIGGQIPFHFRPALSPTRHSRPRCCCPSTPAAPTTASRPPRCCLLTKAARPRPAAIRADTKAGGWPALHQRHAPRQSREAPRDRRSDCHCVRPGVVLWYVLDTTWRRRCGREGASRLA